MRVFGAGGKPEPGYRPDPSGQSALHDLAVALAGRSFDESQIGQAAAYLRTVAGTRPTIHVADTNGSLTPLAPYVALLGLLTALGSTSTAFTGRRLAHARCCRVVCANAHSIDIESAG